MRHVVLFSLRVLILVDLPLCALAKPPPTPFPAPFAEDSEATVYAGKTTPVRLKLSGSADKPTFFIKSRPGLGSLGKVRMTGPNSAEVDYTPSSRTREGTDQFTFSARSWNTEESRPATVRIEIIPEPARLVHARKMVFGSVAIGDSKALQVELANDGGSPFPLAPRVDAPWRIEGNIPPALAAGDRLELTLVFEPLESGAFVKRLALSASGSESIALEGTGNKPLLWNPRGIEIPSDSRATGEEMRFENISDSPRLLSFDWPAEISAPEQVEIPPRESLAVPVCVKPDAPPDFFWDGDLAFDCGSFGGTFRLVVHPAPPQLSVEPGKILDLGEVALGEKATGNLTISNSGGLPGLVRFRFAEEFKSLKPATSLPPSGRPIPPGASESFEVSATPPDSGKHSFKLEVLFENRPIAALTVLAAARAAQPIEKLLSIPKPAQPVATPAPPVARGHSIPIRIIQQGYHSVTVKWDIPEGSKKFFFERREIGPGGAPDWVRLDRFVEIRTHGETGTAVFRKIPAGTFWVVRLRSHDEAGVLNPPPPGIRIETKPHPVVPFWIWFPALLALLLAIVAYIKKRFSNGSTDDDLDARINRLEK